MADPIAQLCQIIAEQLRDEPELEQADLVVLVERAIGSNSELASALKTDERMLQINRDGARGFQTLVEEGRTVFFEDTHYHLTEPERLQAALEAVLQTIQIPKAKTFDFKPYLQSILGDKEYRGWQDVYTPTTVEGRKQVLQKKFLPRLKLRVETVNPPTEKSEERKASEDQDQIEQWEVLAGLRNYATDHVLLIGKPGSGKSTALAWLLWQEANTALQNPDTKIPVLVKLRYCTSTIEELIQNFFKRHRLCLSIADIKELLDQGKLLLLLDGLNELLETFRTEIVNFRDRCRSTTPMIVSTRELSVVGTLSITKTLKMLPLTEPQMQEFVRGYLGEESDRLFQQLKRDQLRKFAETPLLLWMLCQVFDEESVQSAKENRTPQLPDSLGLAFRKFTRLYDQGTEEQQAIQADAPVDSRRQWPKLLRHLAFALMQDKELVEFRLSIPREEAETLLTGCLQQEGRANARDCAERWLNDLLTYHLIQPVIQPNFEEHIEFRHQLIQEYYAAEYLLRLLPGLSDEDLKRDYLNYLKWTEPIALMLPLLKHEGEDLGIVNLSLDLDWRMGACLSRAVKLESQKQAVMLISSLDLPQWIKVDLLAETQSNYGVDVLDQILIGEKETYPWRVVEALGKIESEHAEDSLLNILSNNHHPLEFWNAAEALGKFNSERALEGLLPKLVDQDFDVRRRSAEALGKIGSEKALKSLLIALNDVNNNVRESAAFALGEIGSEQAVEGLITALADEDIYVRGTAAVSLGEIGSEQAVNSLLIVLSDEDEGVRCRAAEALGKIGSEQAIEGLIAALTDEGEGVRRCAAEALGEIGSEQAVESLITAFTDEDIYVRMSITETLGKIGSKQAIEGLITALADEDICVRGIAAASLGRVASELTVEELLVALRCENESLHRSVVSALGKIGSSQVVDGLMVALTDGSFYVRRGAVETLGKIQGSGAARCLSSLKALIPMLSPIQEVGREVLKAILRIQIQCKFYNYEVWQDAIKRERRQTSLAEQPAQSSSAVFFALRIDKIDQQTQHIEEQLEKALPDLKNLLIQLQTQHPQVTTEAEALTIIDTEFTEIKQVKTHQLATLRQQILNPERHLQAIKAAGGEVAKHYLEESVWAKAVITYLDKMSETPNQGA